MSPLRVGVIFGGRSGEHEVSLASAASVIAALERRGHAVVPIGIARDGRWVVGGDPLRALASQARAALPQNGATGAVKKALADRAGQDRGDRSAASPDCPPPVATERSARVKPALERREPAGGMPAELRAGLDVVVLMLHGPYGEDGTIQGLLELADVPYVGAGVLASAVGMDKATMKAVFQAHGLPIVKYTVVLRHEWREQPAAVARRVREVTGFPCFVKPSNLGSSVGISKVRKASELARALDEAARHDRKIVVERAVKKPREVEVSVLGNDAPQASLPGEITYDAEWYDYATKYTEGEATVTVPARIGARLTARVRDIAIAAFRAVDCAGMARVDFFIEDGRVILNEINTIPGFTATSAYARLWEATGIPYEDLVERLVALGLERYRDTRST
jgi:D-alanine-D-alanine ligase